MTTPPDATLEQKLYDYAIVLLKGGSDLKTIRQNLMEYGADFEMANQIVMRASQRPSELVSRKKASRDTLMREAKRSAVTMTLIGIALSSLSVALSSAISGTNTLLSSSKLVLLILNVPVWIGSLISLFGLYRWIKASSDLYDDHDGE